MTFPHINLKGTNYELTAELTELVSQKLEPLVKFIPDGETDLTCQVELQKITDQQSGRIHRAEINLRVAGRLYRAEATEDTMERAIDVMRDEVKRELRRANAKRHSMFKRGGQAIKDMLRRG